MCLTRLKILHVLTQSSKQRNDIGCQLHPILQTGKWRHIADKYIELRSHSQALVEPPLELCFVESESFVLQYWEPIQKQNTGLQI